MEVNVPGVIAMLAAPVVTQLSVEFEPGLMPVGFAAKEVIVGVVPFPVDEVDDPPQPVNAAQASRMQTNRRRENRARPNRLVPGVGLFVS